MDFANLLRLTDIHGASFLINFWNTAQLREDASVRSRLREVDVPYLAITDDIVAVSPNGKQVHLFMLYENIHLFTESITAETGAFSKIMNIWYCPILPSIDALLRTFNRIHPKNAFIMGVLQDLLALKNNQVIR